MVPPEPSTGAQTRPRPPGRGSEVGWANTLSQGLDIGAVDSDGETPMHGAAYKDLPAVVEKLAAKGAGIAVWNKENAHGWTPLTIARG